VFFKFVAVRQEILVSHLLGILYIELQCVVVGCSELQCVAVSCSELQCVAVSCSVFFKFVAVRQEILVSQMLGILYIELQCCSVLQCVAVCCSELQ